MRYVNQAQETKANKNFKLYLSFVFIISPWLHGLELLSEKILILLVILLSFLHYIINSKRSILNNFIFTKTQVVFLAYLISSSISIYLYSEYEVTNSRRVFSLTHNIVEIASVLGLILFYLLIKNYCVTKREINNILFLIITGIFITEIYSAFNYYLGGKLAIVSAIPPWTYQWSKGIRGTFSYKNHYAFYISISIPLALYLYENVFKSYKYGLTITATYVIFSFYIISNTSSRGIFFTLTVTLLYIFIRTRTLSIKNNCKRIIIVLPILIAIISYSSFIARLSNDGINDKGRIALIENGFNVASNNLLLGVGIGNYQFNYQSLKSSNLKITKMSKRVHNEYIEFLAEIGLIGFCILVFSVYKFFSNHFKINEKSKSKIYLESLLLMIFIQAIFDDVFSLLLLAIIFFTILAVYSKIDSVNYNGLHSNE